jgi:Flp pilus assembly protein TadD
MVFAGGLLVVAGLPAAEKAASVTIDYPAQGSVLPPEFPPPTFLWRAVDDHATEWRIDVSFAGGARPIHLRSPGQGMKIGEIDPRCVADTNKPPELTPEQAAAHTWTPDASVWAAIKQDSVERAVTVTISPLKGGQAARASVTFTISKDPVGAPIFYRDVPLMPSATEKGVIKPLAANAVPLIAWRLRNVGETGSRVLLTGMRTCANCHSFSADGKTLGMDLDGPLNDKGLYALASVKPRMSIRTEDMISWNSPNDPKPALERVGFMSQVSPDGSYVLTGLSGLMGSLRSAYYVVNFKDYRFLQVFYPTRGILAWYSRAAGRRQPLPGADDPRYVQTDGVWSPDGKSIVFARAAARDPYPADGKMAERSNDPDEVQIQYDLYRIPFNDGQGGSPEPIAGASANGMSNTFPKVSPDGRWIVFVKCRNGQLMRPDSQLYIVPFEGGEARRMRCNTSLMNSWHSFSPNGRWLVFSSKSRSPYTQMFLTHIDEKGNDSPAILIENATAANRAVNLPEFVNIPPDGLTSIEVPAVDFYRQFDVAFQVAEKGDYRAAIPEWEKAVKLDPADARAQINLGDALAALGQTEEALARYRKAQEVEPENPYGYSHLGGALVRKAQYAEAIPALERALQINPGDAKAHNSLGFALARTGRSEEALAHYRKALEIDPSDPESYSRLGVDLAQAGKFDEALPYLERASELNPKDAAVQSNLGATLVRRGRIDEAIAHCGKALELDPGDPQAHTNLGVALATAGKLEEAVAQFDRAVQLAPENASFQSNLGAALAERGRVAEAIPHLEKALQIHPQDAQAQVNVALALASINRLSDAIPHLQIAAQLTPEDAVVRGNLALALAQLGRIEEAVPHMEQALRLAPGSAEGHSRLGAMYAMRGRFPEALAQWREALNLNPNHVGALNQAAQLLSSGPDASLRDGPKAVEFAQRAARLAGDREPAILDALAAAYAEAGRFPEAVETARHALDLANQAGDRQLADGLRARLALYQAGRPFRAAQPSSPASQPSDRARPTAPPSR